MTDLVAFFKKRIFQTTCLLVFFVLLSSKGCQRQFLSANANCTSFGSERRKNNPFTTSIIDAYVNDNQIYLLHYVLI